VGGSVYVRLISIKMTLKGLGEGGGCRYSGPGGV
jgi:hypothetical protein